MFGNHRFHPPPARPHPMKLFLPHPNGVFRFFSYANAKHSFEQLRAICIIPRENDANDNLPLTSPFDFRIFPSFPEIFQMHGTHTFPLLPQIHQSPHPRNDRKQHFAVHLEDHTAFAHTSGGGFPPPAEQPSLSNDHCETYGQVGDAFEFVGVFFGHVDLTGEKGRAPVVAGDAASRHAAVRREGERGWGKERLEDEGEKGGRGWKLRGGRE